MNHAPQSAPPAVLAERSASGPHLRLAALIAAEAISGPARQLTALVRHLAGAGVEPLVLLFHRRGRPYPTLARYLEAERVPHEVIVDRGPWDWRPLRTVGRVLRAWRPSVVQTHSYKATAIAYLLRQLGATWPWVGFFHGATTEDPKARLYHWLDRRLLRAADRVVVMSRAQLSGFAPAAGKTRVIYNAVLAPHGNDEPAERARSAGGCRSPTSPCIAVIARLSREKGVDLFLDACAALAARGVSFSAVVAGAGPERARLETQRRALGLEQRVVFLGQVENMRQLYAQVDLVVIPSRSEGLPNVLLEAVWAGVPVVATGTGAIPEIVGDTPAAVLVPAGSASGLTEGIERALATETAAKADPARLALANSVSLHRRADEHLALYAELLAGGTSA